MGIALSQYNINQVLHNMVAGIHIKLPISELPIFSEVTPEVPEGVIQEIAININPDGIGFDLASQPKRLDIIDMTFDYIEKNNAEEDGDIKSSVSVDMSLEINLSVRSEEEGLFIDLEMKPISELCHANGMTDYTGTGIYDDPAFVDKMFKKMIETSKNQEGDSLKISIPLSNLGFTAVPESDDPVAIEYDDNGNCFLNLVVNSIGVIDNLYPSSAN